MFSDSKYSNLSAYGNIKLPPYSRVIMERISGAKAPTPRAKAPTPRAKAQTSGEKSPTPRAKAQTSGDKSPTPRAKAHTSGAVAPTPVALALTSEAKALTPEAEAHKLEADVATSCRAVDIHNFTVQTCQSQASRDTQLWARPTPDTYAEIESQKQGPFDKTLGNLISEMYASKRADTSAPTRDTRGLALDNLILNEVMESSDLSKNLSKVLGITVEVDKEFALFVSGNFDSKNKKLYQKIARHGGTRGLIQYKNTLDKVVTDANRFANDNIVMCLNPSVNSFSCKGKASTFGVIAIVLKILCNSEAGEYIANRMNKYSDEKLQRKIRERSYSFCPTLEKLCLPMVFELRLALTEIAYSASPVIANITRKLVDVFNPFEDEEQENRLKMMRYSTIFMSPQLSKHISSSTNSVRPEQMIWLHAMRDTYEGYAQHIIAHSHLKIIPSFRQVKALAAQMGAGKTTVAAIGTGPIQEEANQLLRKAKVVASIVTAIVEPSLKVSANFAGKMPHGARTWLIINGRIVPMHDATPIEITGRKWMPERHITDGDYTFSHDYSSKGRNKELRGLSIIEQIDWFFGWEKKFASTIINPTRAEKRSSAKKAKTMKPSRSGYMIPTHIFCDPKSAYMLFSYKEQLRNRGIFLVGMIDEIVACADCGEATPEENPLAYWYSKLATKIETGWYLSASYSRTNFEHIEVLPSVEDAVSFTQLQLHSGEYVTPLNGLTDLSKEERLAAVDAWSPRVLRLFPPTLIPAMTKMMKKPFKVCSHDLTSSVIYIDMVRRLCKAIIEDENVDQICDFTGWKPLMHSPRKTDSALNVYTGNPAIAAIELLGGHAITIAKIDVEKEKYEREVDLRIEELKRQKSTNARLAKNHEAGLIQMSSDDIQEEIERLTQSKSRLNDRIYFFNTPFGGSTIKGDILDQLVRMSEQDIALALSGIEFDSLAFSPELEKICRDIKISNSRCEFVGVANVYGVNDSSIQKVIIRGDPTNLGRESVCQAAGRTARSFDGRNQIGIMAISEAVLKVFADTTSIMDHFSKNIASVLSNAAVKIQSNFRGYLERKFHMEVWHSAAVHIQRLYRDYMDRKRLAISHVVISIQKIARGYITRKRLQYVSAVTSIQKIVRGFIVRADIARIRSQREYRARLLATDPQFRRYEEQRGRRRASAVSSCRAAEDGDIGTMSVRASEGSWTRVGRARPEPTHREPPRITGFIDRWISERGIGFIRVDGRQRNLYFSLRNIQDGYIPTRGEEVSCTVFTGKRGDEAGDLRPVRYTGTIRSWDAKVAYGFIIMDDPDYRGDLFIPIKNIRGYDHRTRTSEYVPRRNDRVECGRITRTVRGEQRFEAYELVQM